MKRPSKREVIDELDTQIRSWRESYMELIGVNKGRVTDPAALRAMACLREAKRLIKLKAASR